MLKNNLKMLDIDEHLRERWERLHALALKVCKREGCILDCASSDVVMYVQNCPDERVIKEIAACCPRADADYAKSIYNENEWVL